MHATHYMQASRQKHVTRMLFMIPVYSVSNLLPVVYYRKNIYFLLIGNAYAAFGLASFFNLLSSYIAPNLHQQKGYFRHVTPRKWNWPVSWLQKCTGGAEKGLLRTPSSGLTWFNINFFGVFQYCFVLMATSIAGVIAQIFDRYCSEAPIQPAFAHIWAFRSLATDGCILAELSQILAFNTASAIVSSFCLGQYHDQIVGDVNQWKTKFQFSCIKIVLYLLTYQNLLMSILLSLGAFRASKRFQTPDLRVSLPGTLLCAEMAIISLLHLRAYPYRPYTKGANWTRSDGSEVLGEYKGGAFGLLALVDVLNWWDIVKAICRAAKWMVVGRRSRQSDPSYNVLGKYTGDSQFGDDHRLQNLGPRVLPPRYAEPGDDAHVVEQQVDDQRSNSVLLGQGSSYMARGETESDDRYRDAYDIGLVSTPYQGYRYPEYI
ncbi:uncharacterized protein PV07_09997 [Cladophialophora immunda]|uniref:Uncharacterized protein n=1 Tax=Cladophialophora immunda TaxID=569365 RepID=A0A0D2C197_9EURO|nr:uncharacterized protein PV07_09997 [Cladophialophora immunda]KIW24270.1 hypothetical protein PV07_09997 [Cladophialophora immunda]